MAGCSINTQEVLPGGTAASASADGAGVVSKESRIKNQKSDIG